MRDRKIRIFWTNPIEIEGSIQSLDALFPGLYYITRVWGDHETSLYIGKATRTTKERLCIHNREWVHSYRGKIYVRIGKIVYPQNFDADIIDHAESALIYEHRSILKDNTDKRDSYSYSELYQIENTGNFYELHPIVRMHDHPDYKYPNQ